MFVWRLSRCLAPQKHTVHSNVTFIGSILSFLNKRSPNPRVNVAPEKQLHHFGGEQWDSSCVVLRLVRLCFVIHLCVFRSTRVCFWWLILSPHTSHRCQEAILGERVNASWGQGRILRVCLLSEVLHLCQGLETEAITAQSHLQDARAGRLPLSVVPWFQKIHAELFPQICQDSMPNLFIFGCDEGN